LTYQNLFLTCNFECDGTDYTAHATARLYCDRISSRVLRSLHLQLSHEILIPNQETVERQNYEFCLVFPSDTILGLNCRRLLSPV